MAPGIDVLAAAEAIAPRPSAAGTGDGAGRACFRSGSRRSSPTRSAARSGSRIFPTSCCRRSTPAVKAVAGQAQRHRGLSHRGGDARRRRYHRSCPRRPLRRRSVPGTLFHRRGRRRHRPSRRLQFPMGLVVGPCGGRVCLSFGPNSAVVPACTTSGATQNVFRRAAISIRISNSQAFSFSRRKASEVCQSLANRARRWSGGRRQGACEAPSEAGLMYPPRAARHRARPRLGAAPPSAPPATRPSTVPGRPGPASSRSVRCRIASRKRPLVRQDTSRISEVLRTGIGIHSQIRERRFF